MQIDPETVRWILSGVFFIGGSLISWFLGRQIKQLDDKHEDHDERISTATNGLAAFQLDVAKNYVSKLELKEQLESQIAPLRDDMRDIKADVKTLLKKP